jgi:hypothetical protein
VNTSGRATPTVIAACGSDNEEEGVTDGHHAGIRDEGESSVNVRFMGFTGTEDRTIRRCQVTAGCPAAGLLAGTVALPASAHAGAEGS